MTSNLTRFYFEFDDDCRTGCFEGKVFEDVDKSQADEYEEALKQKGIEYARIEL